MVRANGIYLESIYLNTVTFLLMHGHEGLQDISIKIIDRTDTSKPTERETFWIYNLNTFTPNYFLNL